MSCHQNFGHVTGSLNLKMECVCLPGIGTISFPTDGLNDIKIIKESLENVAKQNISGKQSNT
jgi:hypothetical protein